MVQEIRNAGRLSRTRPFPLTGFLSQKGSSGNETLTLLRSWPSSPVAAIPGEGCWQDVLRWEPSRGLGSLQQESLRPLHSLETLWLPPPVLWGQTCSEPVHP